MRRRRRKESGLRPVESKRNKPTTTNWLEQRTIVIDINNVGAAIPLTFGMEGISPSGGTSAIPAFLFSVQSIMFRSQRGEAGNAKVRKFSFQFVDKFAFIPLVNRLKTENPF
jgi:hypothetical protein